eukprot:5552885-Pyramimonas_sp.AAC.1
MLRSETWSGSDDPELATLGPAVVQGFIEKAMHELEDLKEEKEENRPQLKYLKEGTKPTNRQQNKLMDLFRQRTENLRSRLPSTAEASGALKP